jgi:hypothetical protein
MEFVNKAFKRIITYNKIRGSPQGPTFVGTGSGAPEVPELHSA